MAWTFYNSTGEILTNFGPVALTDLDIDGGTDIGAAIVDADLFIVDDGAGGTNRKTEASRIKSYVAVPSQANEAALEAETNEDSYAAPDMIKYSPGVAKAWVRIAADGTIVTGSFNVASITDTGTGDRIIIWDIDFADTNYLCVNGIYGAGEGVGTLSENMGAPAVGSQALPIRKEALLRDVDTGTAAFGNQ